MDIETIEYNVSFDQAIDLIIKHATQIKKKKEITIKDNYQSETKFNIATAMRIDSIESLSNLIKKYLDKMDD